MLISHPYYNAERTETQGFYASSSRKFPFHDALGELELCFNHSNGTRTHLQAHQFHIRVHWLISALRMHTSFPKYHWALFLQFKFHSVQQTPIDRYWDQSNGGMDRTPSNMTLTCILLQFYPISHRVQYNEYLN